MADLRVRDLMTSDVFTLRSNDTVRDAYDLMDLKHVRHVPVVNADGELAGIVSHRDLLKTALGQVRDLPVTVQRDVLESLSLTEVMTVVPETVDADMTVEEAGQLLLEYKFGCLPVVEGQRLVGIITEADFVRYVIREDTSS